MPQPFIKFYLRDWDADRELGSCSLAAQGLWIRMLRVMHEAEPYGYFVGRNGEVVQPSSFARSVGQTPAVVRKLIAELEAAGVFSRDADKRIFSRRMVRDAKKRAEAVMNGRLGGNPKLKGEVNHIGYPDGLRPMESQKPEARPHLVRFAHSIFARSEPGGLTPEDPAWLATLADEFEAIAGAELQALSVDQRLVLGRVHAALCSGFSADERKNRTKAASLAASFARMATSPRLGDMTARLYAQYAWKTLRLRDWKPFHNPFDIEAVVEYVPAARPA